MVRSPSFLRPHSIPVTMGSWPHSPVRSVPLRTHLEWPPLSIYHGVRGHMVFL